MPQVFIASRVPHESLGNQYAMQDADGCAGVRAVQTAGTMWKTRFQPGTAHPAGQLLGAIAFIPLIRL
ncbi:MAG TPA: hypothetical protein DCS07_08365 [Bdellovibrionales bacterium]|nr:MAG: hypothetical protein A2Z97_07985 [Bdellovibrionales bacterium GWB1_52_6]OFZ06440.1 MAG: hypothetical protein A2X97_03200 [Bdellovibrionales bacterium GWA1_52_35]OFZ38434.1 MAG: hypothetical protein A2070_10855 [Bdellovibrionales bacterium GWC1_52_8]HAR42628.1 hypothetical protein [Bdellovibrionales bacterium]HCM40200.1 hypothetical protein [Bdellovibrionales bacterium]